MKLSKTPSPPLAVKTVSLSAPLDITYGCITPAKKNESPSTVIDRLPSTSRYIQAAVMPAAPQKP